MPVPGYKHDLFLSYAHAEAQWVDAFKKAFRQGVHGRDGKPVSIWQDSLTSVLEPDELPQNGNNSLTTNPA